MLNNGGLNNHIFISYPFVPSSVKASVKCEPMESICTGHQNSIIFQQSLHDVSI
jgi:hypothetical protein